MPYKNREKQLKAQRAHYQQHKEQYRLRNNKRRQAIHKWYLEYKATKCCSRCGENHVACLEFHHTSDDKLESLNNEGIGLMALKGYGIDKIKIEIDKCTVLCSNCHRKEHFNIDGKRKIPV